jgi:hypothetical protein
LKYITASNNTHIAGQTLTNGISKTLSYWDPNTLVQYSGMMWELDPVEVRSRAYPARRTENLAQQELGIFTQENVNVAAFRQYLIDNNLALSISRDVTHRDKTDHQQPYYLRVAGTSHQSANASGKIYDISDLQYLQGDRIRGRGMTSPSTMLIPGRRVLAQPMHDAATFNPPLPAAPTGSAHVAPDGSLAAFVPAHRALTWQLMDSTGKPVVRERYWVSFASGEIRVCASCHGTNDDAISPFDPAPANAPQALDTLLRFWKETVLPSQAALIAPANDSLGVPLQYDFTWDSIASSIGYHLEITKDSAFNSVSFNFPNVSSSSHSVSSLAPNTTYYWRVAAIGKYGDGNWSTAWSFTTADTTAVVLPSQPILASPANNASNIPVQCTLLWDSASNTAVYHLQVSGDSTFSSLVVDQPNLNGTSYLVNGLAHSATYYWRVEGVNNNGSSNWSTVWSFTTAAALAVEENGAAVHSFNLSQNYPNPFADVTTISFTLPLYGTASLKLFDALGREVETVFSGFAERGEKTVTLDATNLPAGEYILRLITAEGIRSRMVQLVR